MEHVGFSFLIRTRSFFLFVGILETFLVSFRFGMNFILSFNFLFLHTSFLTSSVLSHVRGFEDEALSLFILFTVGHFPQTKRCKPLSTLSQCPWELFRRIIFVSPTNSKFRAKNPQVMNIVANHR